MEARRNGHGSYLVHQPELSKKTGKPLKGKEIGYTRTTNIAKLLEDPYSLISWRTRHVLGGLFRSPELIEEAKRLCALPVDEFRNEFDDLANRALELGPANDGAAHGTAVHALAENVLNGDLDVTNILPTMSGYIQVMLSTLIENHLEVVPGSLEQMIVNDEHKIGGTFDHLLRALTNVHNWPKGVIRIGDIKTTKAGSIEYAFNAYCIQLGIYANSTPYDQHPEFGGTRKEWPPEFDRTRGIIVHVPVALDLPPHCDLYVLDLEAGWEAAQHAIYAHNWRKREYLATRWYAEPDKHMTKLLEESVEIAVASKAVTPIPKPAAAPVQPDRITLVEVEVREEPATTYTPILPGHEADHLGTKLRIPTPATPPATTPEEEPFMTAHEIQQAAQQRIDQAKAVRTDLFAPAGAPAPVQPVSAPVPQPAVQPAEPLLRAGGGSGLFEAVLGPSGGTPAVTSLIPESVSVPVLPDVITPFPPTPTTSNPLAITALDITQVFPGAQVVSTPKRLAQLTKDYGIKPGEDGFYLTQERGLIKKRVQVISAHAFPPDAPGFPSNSTALDALASVWPHPIPGFGGGHEHTWAELELIEEACWKIEGIIGLPFPEQPFVKAAEAPFAPKVEQADPAYDEPPTEGDMAKLVEALNALTPEARKNVEALGTACAEAGHPIKASLSMRNWAIVWALINLADLPLDRVQAILIHVAGQTPLWDLTPAQTIAMLDTADLIAAAQLHFDADANGVTVVVPF